jgi:indole-3-glycerol phosphate synthase
MATILDQILATKRVEVEAAKSRIDSDEMIRRAKSAEPVRDFAGALRRGPGDVRLIAEVKRASPSAGTIREPFDPVGIATDYAASGAACISVLTDENYFRGHLDYLRQIRRAVDIPLLRKDFIIDPYQVYEARWAGADCILLIAECLDPDTLGSLHRLAGELGMATLIELYDPENLPAVLQTGGEIVGVNNRDLRSFVTDLQHTIRMRQLVPNNRILVGESGIRSHDDVRVLAAAGVDAMLVGESLMREDDIRLAVRKLLGIETGRGFD